MLFVKCMPVYEKFYKVNFPIYLSPYTVIALETKKSGCLRVLNNVDHYIPTWYILKSRYFSPVKVH